MAIAVTGKTNQIASAVASGIGTTSPSFNPATGSLVVVVAAMGTDGSFNGATGWSISDSQSLTWTKQLYIDDTQGVSTVGSLVVFTAPVPTGAAMTVTVTVTFAGGSDTEINFHVHEVTGHRAGAPLSGNTVTAMHIGTAAVTLTLPSPVSAESAVIAARGMYINGLSAPTATPGVAYTEIYDTSSDLHLGLQSQYRLASTASAADWVDVEATGGLTELVSTALAFEIRVADVALMSAQTFVRRRTPMIGF